MTSLQTILLDICVLPLVQVLPSNFTYWSLVKPEEILKSVLLNTLL